MKSEKTVIVLSIVAAMIFWALDAFIDYVLHYEEPFIELLFFHEKEVAFRLLFSLCFFIFGLLMAKAFTKQKRAEEELKKHGEDLEKLVNNRTVELKESNMQLQNIITEYKIAEEHLHKSEDKFRTYYERAPLGYQSLDENGCLIDVNDAWLEVMQYSRDEVVGKSFADFLAPVYVKKFSENFPCFKKAGEILGIEFEMVKKDGSHVIMSINGRIGYNEKGDFLQTHCILNDITESKKTSYDLLKASEEWRKTFDSITDFISVLDNEFRFVRVNKTLADFLGKKPKELIGKYCYEEIHGLKVPFLGGSHEEMLKLKSPITKEIYDPKLGLHLLISVSPLYNVDGEIDGSVHFTKDITDRKNLEAQLLQAQKMETVGQLAGGVAHDFNNILGAIMNYGYILKNKLNNDEHKELVLHILESTDKAAKLTSDLLSFSRKQILQTAPVKLNEIIKRVDKLISRIIGEDIEIKIILTEKDPVVIADSSQIEQVLMNLFSNARDAMLDGGTLTIETEETEMDDEYIRTHGYGESGRYVLLSVTDTGKGMDVETRKQIFEPFYTTKEVGKGTGIGLAMVYGIIKQHNGFVNVYSELGKGTTFKIYLPVTGKEVGEVKPTVPETITKGTETVLLAEDNEELRIVTKQLLEEHGYKVIEAVNGEDAVAKFNINKERIQLLFFDSVMPKKSGKKAYDEIRKVSPDIKILFMSGYTEDSIVKNSVLKEGLNFISKPVVPKELFKKIREVLSK